jgi:hypothetical protein
MKAHALQSSIPPASNAAADFYGVSDSAVAFVPAAPGRFVSRNCGPPSLVQTLMAGGGGGTLPTGVVALGQEKRAIESLLQNVRCS